MADQQQNESDDFTAHSTQACKHQQCQRSFHALDVAFCWLASRRQSDDTPKHWALANCLRCDKSWTDKSRFAGVW